MRTISVGLYIFLAGPLFADDVPRFNVKKNCHVDVVAYQGNANSVACVADEQKARNTLIAQWKRFSSSSRSRCAQMVGEISGSQSYVELLTCLQMAQDVKTLPKQ